jgi:hypothetical protein
MEIWTHQKNLKIPVFFYVSHRTSLAHIEISLSLLFTWRCKPNLILLFVYLFLLSIYFWWILSFEQVWILWLSFHDIFFRQRLQTRWATFNTCTHCNVEYDNTTTKRDGNSYYFIFIHFFCFAFIFSVVFDQDEAQHVFCLSHTFHSRIWWVFVCVK